MQGAFLQSLEAPSALLTDDGKVALANEAFQQAFGGAVHTGEPMSALLPLEAHKQALNAALGRMLSERLPHQCIEALAEDKNKNVLRRVRLNLTRLRYAVSSSEGFLAVCECDDAPESDVHLEEGLLAAALQAAGLGIWQYIPSADCLRLSKTGLLLLNGSGDDLQFSGNLDSFLALVCSDYRGMVESEFRRCLAEGGGKSFLHVEFPVGETQPGRWVALRGQGIANTDGNSCDLLIGIVEDMTGHRLTEQALRKSDDIFRQLTENVAGVFWMRSHEDNSLLYVSPGYEEIWGRSVNELFQNPQAAINSIHPDDIKRVIEVTRQSSTAQLPFHYEVDYRIVRPDGSIRWVSDHAFPILDGNGRILRRAGLVTDITENKLAEERLNLLGTALEAAANSIVITDQNGIICWVNPAFLAVTGYKEDEVIGKPTGMLKSGLHDKKFYEEMWSTIRSGRVWRGEISNKRKDGSIYQEEMTITPVRGAHGHIEHYIAIKQDITDRIIASQALAQSERKYRNLFHAAHDAIFLLREGSIIDINKHAETLLECPRRHIIGKNLNDFAPVRQPDGTDSEERIRDIIQKANLLKGIEIEWKGKRWDGTLFDAELTASNVRFGSEDWVQVVIRDVSERRRIEARMRQNQKLEAIGKLAGGVAHDFNNLLLVITGHLELLLTTIGANQTGRSHIEKARTAARHAADLTRQLLAFSRQQVMVSRVLNLSEITRESLTLLARLVPPNISIRESLPDEGCLIKGDPGQMRQIIMNLVVNARDAMPEGGNIHVTTRLLDISSPLEIPSNSERLQTGQYVVWAIKDSGHGMDADTLARIFDPFFTTKAKGRGTGLGLATVFGIVKQSGGEITVESQPGKGTTFTIYFPRAKEEDVGQNSTGLTTDVEIISKASSQAVVVIVEDEDAVRSLVSQILIAAGYKVLAAETPREAIRLLEERNLQPNLLIADIVLPEISGPELAAALQERCPSLKVLYTSGYSESSQLPRGSSFIQKPYGANALVQKVQSMLKTAEEDRTAHTT